MIGAMPSVAVVVLTIGQRPVELARALSSALAQTGVDLDVLCIGNGVDPGDLGPGVRTMTLPENLGMPAARQIGARETTGELILFLDDDAWMPEPDTLSRIAAMFGADARLGAVQPRICSPEGETMRRWVPRVRVGDPARSGPAFALAEGVTVVRRHAFDVVGGWPGHFFYGHEGVDLAWRLYDAGWHVRYAGDVVLNHPASSPARHAVYYRMNARNRVWVARRNLPALLIPLYLGAWTALTIARNVRRPDALRVWFAGFVEGWRTDAGTRRPMRWRTVLHLAALGQPPVV